MLNLKALVQGGQPAVDSGYLLPDEAVTRAGDRFDPRLDRWSISGPGTVQRINFDGLHGLAPQLVESFKGLTMNLVATRPASSAVSEARRLKCLLCCIAADTPGAASITLAHLINYRAKLEKRHLHRSTDAHRIIRAWAKLGLPGIEPDALVFATDAPKTAHETGRAVRQRCPVQGPYTDLEYDGLHRELHVAFGRGRVSLSNYGLCLLSGSIAPRPLQLALLQVGDLKRVNGPDRAVKYILSVPRIKGRNVDARTQFTDRELVSEIGEVIEAQASIVREKARLASVGDPEAAPLFPNVAGHGSFAGSGPGVDPPTAIAIKTHISMTLEGLQVISERTGGPINVTPTRSRRTLGTRGVSEGKRPAELAALLNHSDITSVGPYYAIVAQLLKRISSRIAVELAPLAQRFMGMIVLKGDDPEHDVRRSVYGVVADGGVPEDIGGCSKPGACGLPKPIACYTCRLFRPWVDGPHEAMLEGLLDVRRRRVAEGPLRVASVTDEAILACAEVVRLCGLRARALTEDTGG